MKMQVFIRKLIRRLILIKRSINDRFIHHSLHLVFQISKIGFSITQTIIPLLAVILFGLVIYDVGFNLFYSQEKGLMKTQFILLYALKILMVLRFVFSFVEKQNWRSYAFRLFQVVIIFYMYNLLKSVEILEPIKTNDFLLKKLSLYLGVLFIFSTEVSHLSKFFKYRKLHPTFLFVISFATIILVGMLLLLVPNATVKGISPMDAFFTATSAVCVTGLIVVDTATAFTVTGKIILLILMQIGGLGIMTFAALFSYLASGSSSFQSQIAMKNILNSNKFNNVIQVVLRIVVVTLFFEMIGAILIQWSLDDNLFNSKLEEIFFAVFHAVSAFCNAGFSTFSNGLYETPVRFNYSLHLIVAFLIILGGMGFPIVFNLFTLIRIKTVNFIRRLMKEPPDKVRTHIMSINSKLALETTFILLGLGVFLYLLFEWNGSLQQHPSLFGKIVTSFFGSVTPRTAGFNTVDLTSLTMPTLMVYFLFMWVGASPGSTGGGIKTTTLAVSWLNLGSILKGKSRTEIFRIQVSESSINRAFAVMLSSIMVVGFSILLISFNDGEKGFVNIAFEAFSALGTVGLSLGITPSLSGWSKLVLIFTMFIGRVGTLTFLMVFFQQTKTLYYKYPEEEIMF